MTLYNKYYKSTESFKTLKETGNYKSSSEEEKKELRKKI